MPATTDGTDPVKHVHDRPPKGGPSGAVRPDPVPGPSRNAPEKKNSDAPPAKGGGGESRLEQLARARKRALEVRRERAEVRRKEKDIKAQLWQQKKEKLSKIESKLKKGEDVSDMQLDDEGSPVLHKRHKEPVKRRRDSPVSRGRKGERPKHNRKRSPSVSASEQSVQSASESEESEPDYTDRRRPSRQTRDKREKHRPRKARAAPHSPVRTVKRPVERSRHADRAQSPPTRAPAATAPHPSNRQSDSLTVDTYRRKLEDTKRYMLYDAVFGDVRL